MPEQDIRRILDALGEVRVCTEGSAFSVQNPFVAMHCIVKA